MAPAQIARGKLRNFNADKKTQYPGDVEFIHYNLPTAKEGEFDLAPHLHLQWREVDKRKRSAQGQHKIMRQLPILMVEGKILWLRHMNPLEEIGAGPEGFLSIVTHVDWNDTDNGHAQVTARLIRNAQLVVDPGAQAAQGPAERVTGQVIATGTAFMSANQITDGPSGLSPGKYLQKAETDAVGRCLTKAGFVLGREGEEDPGDDDDRSGGTTKRKQKVDDARTEIRERVVKIRDLARELNTVEDDGQPSVAVLLDPPTAELLWPTEEARKLRNREGVGFCLPLRDIGSREADIVERYLDALQEARQKGDGDLPF